MRPTTTNYALPLWTAETLTSWMNDMNYAMRTIDETMHTLALRSSIDGQPSQELIEAVDKLEVQMAIANSNIVSALNLIPQVANHTEQIANLTDQVGILNTNYLSLDTRMTAIESAVTSLNIAVQKLQETVNQMIDNGNTDEGGEENGS